MPDGQNDAIIKFIGQVTARLENINQVLLELKSSSDIVHRDVSDLKTQVALQAASTKALHHRVDKTDRQIDEHQLKINALQDTIIKETARQRGIFDTINWLWGVAGFLVSIFGSFVLNMLGII